MTPLTWRSLSGVRSPQEPEVAVRTAYRVIAHLVALEVLIQAAAIAYAVFGLGTWIEGGGVLDKAGMESETTDFTGVGGFALHGINGQIVVPVLALALLVVAFFARVPGGVRWAGIVVGLVALQVLLGILGHSVTGLGALHGLCALALFACAVFAGQRAGSRSGAAATAGERVA
ncbi:DUF6220 domain-containing protein [Pseudonocardia sp. ICBG1034]|uniref:DUF6220 domain-containing protein n=1 Tax=Pseudonocardia sp. ICBG1034 TaxID=2844381 RepID=UPI001CC95A9F|nr:DUF6220 domain-containing protein [Pseudonocardia sp. ICBG1034]